MNIPFSMLILIKRYLGVGFISHSHPQMVLDYRHHSYFSYSALCLRESTSLCICSGHCFWLLPCFPYNVPLCRISYLPSTLVIDNWLISNSHEWCYDDHPWHVSLCTCVWIPLRNAKEENSWILIYLQTPFDHFLPVSSPGWQHQSIVPSAIDEGACNSISISFYQASVHEVVCHGNFNFHFWWRHLSNSIMLPNRWGVSLCKLAIHILVPFFMLRYLSSSDWFVNVSVPYVF